MTAVALSLDHHRVPAALRSEFLGAVRAGDTEASSQLVLRIVDALRDEGFDVDSADLAVRLVREARELADTLNAYKRHTNGETAAAKLIDGTEFLDMVQAPQYAARPTLQRGQVVSMTGRTNHGKTTVAHLHIVGVLTGMKVGPFRFKKGRVLLLVGENPANSALQLLAACRRYGVNADHLKNLTVRPAAGRLTDVAAEVAELLKDEYVLVVVDTSTAFFSYEDDNDNNQNHAHAQDAAELTKLPGNPAVLILCHPVKGATQDNLQPRGGSAFLNAIDSNLTVWNDGDAVTLHHTKIRGPAFEPITLALEPEDVGMVDDEGAPVVPVVAAPLSEDAQVELGRKRKHDENRVLWAMLRHPGNSIADWAEVCNFRSPSGPPQKSKVFRILERLTVDKLVRKYRGHYVLTTSGKDEAEKVT